MNKNLDQGFAVECIAAQPRVTKFSKEEEKSLYVFFSVSVLLLALIESFGVSRMRDFYLEKTIVSDLWTPSALTHSALGLLIKYGFIRKKEI